MISHQRCLHAGNTEEIYAEVVLGLGEVLVGNFPGRALSFTCSKSNLDAPTVRTFGTSGYKTSSVSWLLDCKFGRKCMSHKAST